MHPSTDPAFFQLLASSYERLLKRPLVPVGSGIGNAARWLYDEAPFAVLAHDTSPDPLFVYGNRAAQRRFEYAWDEIVGLPSRLSADAPNRDERQAFLQQVERDGYVQGYRGIRVTKSGKRFWIENATVWQLYDDKGTHRGQAAMIPESRDLES
ncbi:MEKHLA domain-containing protein [Burkholderia sp. WSM2230]|uniref:MEKHLA domain-containing protein n=1 Tax=Burkholderia sp. WSM2230 TaxID=944435 RepID=UPI000415043E|nr:MEKHLA domain-containing protein [Burkholderia sp. WSM2230]